MTGQETTMGAPSNCHLLHVELATFQDTFNSKLGKEKTWENCKRIFIVENKERHMEIGKSEVGGAKTFNKSTAVMSHDLNRNYRNKTQLNIETNYINSINKDITIKQHWKSFLPVGANIPL